jgi:CBS domain-containing protein/anti-sigma regulatory factor (Ser/Thr protein kinase)
MKKHFALLSLIGREGALSKVHELVRELKVSRVMTSSVFTLSADATMSELKELLREHRISGVPVIAKSEEADDEDEQEMVGIVSIENLIQALEEGKLDAPIAEFMTREDLIIARAEEPVMEAVKRFEHTGVGRLPVLDDKDKLVGIITRGDVMAALLRALQDVYDETEQLQAQPKYFFEALESEGTNLLLRYHVEAGDFSKGGEASAKIKQALLRIGASPQLARRVAIATYEAEINLVIHTTEGGFVLADVQPSQITIVAQDSGPGIPDVEQAQQPGYSTATSQVREMGFGAGMGLSNIKRCSDDMNMWSAVGVGTRLQINFDVSPEETGK